MTYEVINEIPYFTGLPRDKVVNTFHFEWEGSGDPTSLDYSGLCDTVSNFYETIFPAAGTLYMAGCCDFTKVSQKVYDLIQPKPRTPVFSRLDTLLVNPDTLFVMPLEVSLCLSYQAAPISGVSQASRRGRVYLGPFGDMASGGGTSTSFPAPPTALINNMKTAAHDLKAVVATTHFRWVVHSQKFGISAPIVNGWVDNAWDTQRRRGNSPTSRSVWT